MRAGSPRPEAAPPSLDSAALLDAFERMLTIRRFEEEIQRLFLRGEVHGTTHLYNGQEAVAVGMAAALRPDDLVAATYRGHGHAIAKGVDPFGLAAELMGRAAGTCGGRAGSMNVIDMDHGFIGSFGIIGGTIAAATGAALALRGSGRVAVAYFGDGTVNQAYFAECLNFAKVLSLPVLFVCENNLYGEYTPWEQVTAGADIPARARVYGMRAESADGNDVSVVHIAATAALERVRAGEGPELIEFRTYRQVGHSRSDPARYRPSGELEQWLERDPLTLAKRALREQHQVADGDLAAIEERVATTLDDAFARGLASPYPTPEEAPGEYCHV